MDRTGALGGVAAGLVLALGLALAAGCGERKPSTPAAAEPALAGEAAAPPPAVEAYTPPAEPALGVAALAELAYSGRAGHAAFRRARAAERRGDWARMVEECQAALAADPSHLDASWLLAAGLAHQGRFAEVAAPLVRAVIGDPVKWARPARSLSLFAGFWKSGAGALLEPWLEQQDARAHAMLGRAGVLLHAERLVAYDAQTGRWLPLARPHRVRGALVAGSLVVLVARGPGGGAAAGVDERLGIVELRDGAAAGLRAPAPAPAPDAPAPAPRAVELVALPAARRREVAVVPGDPARVLVRADAGPWQEIVAGHLVALARPAPREISPRLLVTDGKSTVVRHPVAGVSADWDQSQMASALRLRRSNRVVTVPAPALIDGQRLTFNPSGALLGLVAGVESCERSPAPRGAGGARFRAYVVDVLTGAAREVAQGERELELAWLGERSLAVGSDHGVTVIDAASDGSAAPPLELPDVVLPASARRLRCPSADPLDAAPAVGSEPAGEGGDDGDDL